MRNPQGGRALDVIDCGKQDLEHYEFNRGVLAALGRAGIRCSFVGMHSMYRAHASVLEGDDHLLFVRQARRAPAPVSGFAFKLFSLVMAGAALLRSRRDIVVLYAAPIAHLLFAIWSRFTRRRMVVFLHSEIEFLAEPQPQARRVGEHLMLAALALASPRLVYLTLTQNAAGSLRRRYRREGFARFCPHPISPSLLQPAPAPETGAQPGRPRTALLFIKSGSSSEGLRWLCAPLQRASLPLVVNGSCCIPPGGGDLFATLETVRTLRLYLTRADLERELRSSAVYVMTAAENEYRFTASGLACSAVSAGAVVWGCPNPFMVEYSRLYPGHFILPGIHPPADGDAAEAGTSLDNLADIAAIVMPLLGRGAFAG